eukprot:12228981-Heterocapsa_arctica.AAC.1
MDPGSWYGQYGQTTYNGNKGNGPISRKHVRKKTTYCHENSTQKKAEIYKTHTYCMGSIWKDKKEQGHMDLTSFNKIRNKYRPYGQTTYGENKWKGLRLGKTSKENT